MQSSRRFLEGGAIGLSGVVALILCAGLLLPASASAKSAEYTAQLKLPGGAKNGYVQFKVKSKKNKQTKKFRPVLIKKFGVFTVTKCADGVEQEADYYPSLASWPTLFPVSGRQFSLSDSGGNPTTGGTYKYDIDFSGQVPRHGPPAGTLRLTIESPHYAPVDPENPDAPSNYTQRSCDTGPMSWTAQRVPDNTL